MIYVSWFGRKETVNLLLRWSTFQPECGIIFNRYIHEGLAIRLNDEV